MRKRKVRGNRRLLKQVQNWIDTGRHLDPELLRQNGYDYSKIDIYPWRGLSLINSRFPEPKGRMKKAIIHGLITIYESWKTELEKLNEPCYLKIWLYEPRVSRSQVVVATGEHIARYEHLFSKSKSALRLPQASETVLNYFEWEVMNDDDLFWESDFTGTPEEYASEKDYQHFLRLYDKLRNNKIPNVRAEYSGETVFLVKRGNILIGSK